MSDTDRGVRYEWAEWGRLRRSERLREAVIFYSETAGYHQYFRPVLSALLSQPGPPVLYITSDPSDPQLSAQTDRFQGFFFRRLLPFVVQFLRAPVLAMTMTDLHRFHLRRSVFPVNHAYLFHALVSTHMIYRPGAFDHYDTILCAGPHHVKEIRRDEELRKLPPKRLLEAGYPRLDELMEAHRAYRASAPAKLGKGKVLVAPSWGGANILESCGLELAKALSGAGYGAVIRPHPEWVKRNPAFVRDLSAEIGRLPGASLDLEHGSERSLHEADLLVTDWSGIAMEYAFGTERPVLFLDVPRKVNNPGYEGLGITPLEVEIRETIGRVVSPERIAAVPAEIEALLGQGDTLRRRIVEERERRVFQMGRSAEASARFLLELAKPL